MKTHTSHNVTHKTTAKADKETPKAAPAAKQAAKAPESAKEAAHERNEAREAARADKAQDKAPRGQNDEPGFSLEDSRYDRATREIGAAVDELLAIIRAELESDRLQGAARNALVNTVERLISAKTNL